MKHKIIIETRVSKILCAFVSMYFEQFEIMPQEKKATEKFQKDVKDMLQQSSNMGVGVHFDAAGVHINNAINDVRKELYIHD